jgi:hypothetical protein
MTRADLERYAWRSTITSALSTFLLLTPGVAFAQGEINGRILGSDSARRPVVGAEVSIARLRLSAITDSLGRFRLKEVPQGEHRVVLRAIGFDAESSFIHVYHDEVVSLDRVLTRSAMSSVLPERVVTAAAPEAPTPAKLAEFIERRKTASGHFVDRSQMEKAENGMRTTGDVLSSVPGVLVRRGSTKAWLASGRAISTGCAFCATSVTQLLPSDVAAGARPACFMDVYLDGAMVFDSRRAPDGLFDVNTIPPDQIAGIEVYSSIAQVPVKYHRTGSLCGVVLIWTR